MRIAVDPGDSEASGRGPWTRGAGKKLAYLGVARMGSQGLGILWYLIAARALDQEQFGLMASGLAGFAVFTILADLGTTWSVPRYVAADHTVAWSAYRKAIRVRSVGVVVVSVPVVLAAGFLFDTSAAPALALGALVALASGASEIGYATLRSLGRVRLEGVLLPAERIGFITLGVLVLLAGGGAYALLVLYVATNMITAGIIGFTLWRKRTDHPADVHRFWDREARRTGIAFTMLALGPRLNALLIVLLGTVTAVSTYAVAARPVEQLALLVIGLATSMLPLLRTLDQEGRSAASDGVAALASEAVLVSLAAMIAWWIVAPDQFLRLLYGDRYEDAGVVLAVLAVVSVTWAVRGIAGLRLIAGEHARVFVRIGWVGLVLDLALAVALIPTNGARGAAIALAISEVVMLVALFLKVPGLLQMGQAGSYALALAIGGACAAGAWVLRDASAAAAMVNVGVWTAAGLVVAFRLVRRIEIEAAGEMS